MRTNNSSISLLPEHATGTENRGHAVAPSALSRVASAGRVGEASLSEPPTRGGATMEWSDAEANERVYDPSEFTANILLVDDRPDKLLAMEAILSGLGHNLIKAHSGKEALRLLLKQDVAVILLDVSMPEMDGFETASLIRNRARSELTPIIFVTAIGNSENHISRGYSLGAVDYMIAPVVPEILRTKVSVLVELHRKTELIKRQGEQLRQMQESRHRREREEWADRLENETRRNRFFTLSMDLLGIAGMDRRWLQTNPAWCHTLGYTPEELAGGSIIEFAHPDCQAELNEKLGLLSTTALPVQFDTQWRHKDGTWRWFHVTATPFASENLIYVFARDITAQKQADQQIQCLNQELEARVAALTEANRELETFNYSIAHDLRAPLRSMRGFAQALPEAECGVLTATGQDYAQRICRAATYMDTLLKDLLQYSNLLRTEIVPCRVRLEDPVNELLDVLEKEIKERKVNIRVSAPLGEAFGHLPTIKQILGNLVGNSLKFVAPGRAPEIRIFSTRERDRIRLWVEDNGIGIPPQHHERIFGLFARLHTAEAYPGTGIGLALVRRGAERMGGRAGVESTPGEGSRFWFEVPAAPEQRGPEISELESFSLS